MRKILLVGALMLLSVLGKAQFTQSDLIYYVGSGPDTAILVLDFQDATSDSTYAWGYIFDASVTTTGQEMVDAISADEEYLNIVSGGGFLNDIFYNAHSGEAGMPNYWGTWSRTSATEWVLNSGLTEVLANGDWFGCSYTDFDPALAPGEPIPAYESAKYTPNMVSYWVGTGSDSAVFVVDFVTAVYGEAVSYAWGYAFDGPTDATTMLADIDAADVNLSTLVDGFLYDIVFNDLSGIGGDPYYFTTYSGTNLTDWVPNSGLGEVITDGDWFGCSYGEYPARRPFNPISAIDSAAFVADDLTYFIAGEGENLAVIVLDFNEWLPGSSYALGYKFDTETITAQEAMQGIEDAGIFWLDFDFAGGFLNDIVYGAVGEEGIGGMPYYWGTWSALNAGGWELNAGISTELADGDWFGCTYTTFAPATPPSIPTVGLGSAEITEVETAILSVYPNPATTTVNVNLTEASTVTILNLQGQIVAQQYYAAGMQVLNVSDLQSGTYFITATLNGEVVKTKLIIQ